MKRAILAIAAVFAFAGMATAPALAGSHPAPHGITHAAAAKRSSVAWCEDVSNGLCTQAAGFGTTVTAQAANGNPNQAFNIFTESGTCNNGLSTSSCPFPGAPAGKQIVVIGGTSPQNSGLCGGWSGSSPTDGTLVHCNGGTGTIFVLNGTRMESGLVGRQHGGPTYLCVAAHTIRIFFSFTTGACQWNQFPQ